MQYQSRIKIKYDELLNNADALLNYTVELLKCNYSTSGLEKNNSSRKKLAEALARVFLRDVLFCGLGFFRLCAGEEKKQNKFPQICTVLSKR